MPALLSTATLNFDVLADSDEITSDAACVFFGGSQQPISKVTLWRKRRAGLIPEPNAFGRYNMGELRRAKARLKKKHHRPLGAGKAA
jgi:hypothetical protein